ncbi:hypothetical protein CHARACLAT_025141, partial [Characodon lateralis]|nr:hypothetical protein [Characodon lateralis]
GFVSLSFAGSSFHTRSQPLIKFSLCYIPAVILNDLSMNNLTGMSSGALSNLYFLEEL